jgi:hypothetical protein
MGAIPDPSLDFKQMPLIDIRRCFGYIFVEDDAL